MFSYIIIPSINCYDTARLGALALYTCGYPVEAVCVASVVDVVQFVEFVDTTIG